MSPRNVYLGLCVLGTVLPLSQFLPFLREHGLNPHEFVSQLFARPVSGFFGMDVIVSSIALWVFVAIDGHRAGLRHLWAPVAANLVVGVQEGATLLLVFPLSVLLAFLVLAAQYESWSLPLVVILIVPLSVLGAMGGVWLTEGDNNIFTQVGLVVLAGLACKNAILIVEFARELELQGRSILGAALESCRLRLRPILMTSLAFIMGVVPLVISTGAGTEIRRALGVAVFSGMLGVTVFGLFLTPVFYVVVRSFATRRAPTAVPLQGPPPAPEVVHG